MSHVLNMSSALSDTYSEGGPSHRRIQAIPNTNNFMVSFGNAVSAIGENNEKVEDPKLVEPYQTDENVVIHGNEDETNVSIIEVSDVSESIKTTIEVHDDGVEKSGKIAEKEQTIVPEVGNEPPPLSTIEESKTFVTEENIIGQSENVSEEKQPSSVPEEDKDDDGPKEQEEMVATTKSQPIAKK